MRPPKLLSGTLIMMIIMIIMMIIIIRRRIRRRRIIIIIIIRRIIIRIIMTVSDGTKTDLEATLSNRFFGLLRLYKGAFDLIFDTGRTDRKQPRKISFKLQPHRCMQYPGRIPYDGYTWLHGR